VMPANSDSAKSKYLSVRARVSDVSEMPDGRRRLELRFRKPVFKERAKDKESKQDGPARPPRTAHGKWRM
jgi:hypothetical protein